VVVALIVAAGAVALVWAAGAVYLTRHYYRDVRDLRDNLRKTYPNSDWPNMSASERRNAQPFDAQGEAIFHETRAGLRLRRARAQALLASFGLLAIMALILMARTSVNL